MSRAICLMLAILLAAGCKSPPKPSMDPFLGRATVPPPKPGEVVAQRTGDLYYPPTNTATRTTLTTPPPPATATSRLWSSTPPLPPPPARAIDATASAPIRQQSYQQPIYQPPVYQQPVYVQPVYQQPVCQQPVCPPCSRPVRCVNPEDTAPGARLAPASSANANCAPANNAQPAIARTAGQPTLAKPRLAAETDLEPGEPRRLQVDDNVTNIMDLPPATRPGKEAPQETGVVHTASYEPPTSGGDRRGSQTVTKTPAVRNRYGYDSNYTWLKGQLEYSKAARRWKLRYIPIDGETDDHGGSVILADTPALEKFQPGDYVMVEGQVTGPAEQNLKMFSPLYDVRRIDRIKP